ncbi:hypothetical protein C4571_02395 [Candidatus Parcubacteria bacterium]|nr:MAG: hypothetical protein C4571_02395 [Candidatus Parcubacteria bacterium]
MRKAIFTTIAAVAVAASGLAGAAPNLVPAMVEPAGKPVLIPQHAVEVAPHVFDLGIAVDPADGELVQGYAIIHPARGSARGGQPGKPSGKSSCYGFLAKGAKWKSVENWVVNTTNPDGIPSGTIFGILDGGILRWEDAADGTIGDGSSKDVVGAGSVTSSTLVADEIAPDNQNEVYFDALDSGTIGVTIVWGIFGGPPGGRELREWDQVYNTLYSWSAEAAGFFGKMDFDNIVTHELGHTVGLADLYTLSCSDETMYGYGAEAETKKRDLNAGDIAGIKELYK